ncbi:dynamin family protein [Savagea faecisuis]|uniref:Dynamin family protein n=1 Tax=Savagea faecisuis TaxID=1274803 RepID=A0ABW3GWJ3_9BACL
MQQITWQYKDGKSTLEANLKPLNHQIFEQYLYKPFEESVEPILNHLQDSLNIVEIEIVFLGSQEDFDLLSNVLQNSPLRETISLRQEIVPIDFISAIRNRLEQADFRNIEIANFLVDKKDIEKPQGTACVISPQKSGKTSVINALLRENVLPIDNATTNKISRIHLNKDPSETAYAYDKQGALVSESPYVSEDVLRTWNEREDIERVELEGFQWLGLPANLIDTPSKVDIEEYKELRELMQTERNLVLLYVLDAEKIGTVKDRDYFKMLTQLANETGFSLEDRLCLVMNKVDLLKSQKALQKAIEKLDKTIKSSFEWKPDVIFLSAKYALSQSKLDSLSTESPFSENLIDKSLLSEKLRQYINDSELEYFESNLNRNLSGIKNLEYGIQVKLEEANFTSKFQSKMLEMKGVVEKQYVKVDESFRLKIQEQEKRLMQQYEIEQEYLNKAQEFYKRDIETLNGIMNKLQTYIDRYKGNEKVNEILEDQLNGRMLEFFEQGNSKQYFYIEPQYRFIKSRANSLILDIEQLYKQFHDSTLLQKSESKDLLKVIQNHMEQMKQDFNISNENFKVQKDNEAFVSFSVYSKSLVDVYFLQSFHWILEQIDYFKKFYSEKEVERAYTKYLKETKDMEKIWGKREQILLKKAEIEKQRAEELAKIQELINDLRNWKNWVFWRR